MLLTDFLGVIEVATCEINRRALVVICEISEADIKLAIHGFGRLFSKNEDSCENKGRPKLTAYVKQAQNTLKTRRDIDRLHIIECTGKHWYSFSTYNIRFGLGFYIQRCSCAQDESGTAWIDW